MTERVRGYRLQKMRERLFSHQPLCVMCQAQGRVKLAEERDHIIPLHKGGIDHESNTQALCHDCHELKSITERGHRFKPLMAKGLDWLSQPMDYGVNIYVISGLPGVGKTTYVREHMHRGDLIVDVDTLYAALSGLDIHDNPDELLPFVITARDAVIERLTHESRIRNAWIIMGDPVKAASLSIAIKGNHVNLKIEETERLSRLYERGTTCRGGVVTGSG